MEFALDIRSGGMVGRPPTRQQFESASSVSNSIEVFEWLLSMEPSTHDALL